MSSSDDDLADIKEKRDDEEENYSDTEKLKEEKSVQNSEKNQNKQEDIKPLIENNDKPVIDNANNPNISDKNTNHPIQDRDISILLDQFGKPILNSIGEPILINEEGRPINLIDSKKTNLPNIKKKDIFYRNIKPNKKKNKNEKINNNINNNKDIRRFNDENKNDYAYAYPRPNPNYQRKNDYKPVKNVKNLDKDKEYFSNSTCFACDVGCGVSRSGYSPMTYSPFDNTFVRRESTPIKDNIEYYEYFSK